VPSGLALIDYNLLSLLTLIADDIVTIGLALIDYNLVSLLTSIADNIMFIGLALIDYNLVSNGLLQFWAQFSEYGIYYIYR